MVAVMRLPVGLHPRSHGENVIDDGEARTGGDSSPLTRGKLRRGIRRFKKERLIPAHAGKTRRRTRTLAPCGAHPRSRGENIECRPECDADDGSSPLTRGKHLAIQVRLAARGLIPTHAGKTGWRSCHTCRGRAHPHSRGENHIKRSGVSQTTGSSPLTRGKLNLGTWWVKAPVPSLCFPRVSGDEPGFIKPELAGPMFSPREWG